MALVVIDAPSNLGLQPPRPGVAPGVNALAAALRGQGLIDRLGAIDGGIVPAPAYDFAFDPVVGVRNWAAIRAYSLTLADALAPALASGSPLLVLGGDCSVALGVQLALRRRGGAGLIYLDAHDDLQTPATSRTGGAAGMDVAMMLGHGPAALTDLDGAGPTLRPNALAILGVRGGWVPNPVMRDVRATQLAAAKSLAELWVAGMAASAACALARVRLAAPAGFWVHLDADVLDHAVMPAVDSPQPGGMTYPELGVLLGALVADAGYLGLTLTIYDPAHDPTGTAGAGLVDALIAILAPRANHATPGPPVAR